MKTENNKRLSDIFRDMAAIYRYLGEAERFRAIAYSRAARMLDGLGEDISTYSGMERLDSLPGIGEGIAGLIMEFLSKGSIRKYEQLKRSVPFDLLELMDIKGFGPQSLKTVHNELGVQTREQFIRALQDGSVSKIKGFGAGKIEKMFRGLKLQQVLEERLLLHEAMETGKKLIEKLQKTKGVLQIELAGSLRRKKDTIGDFDILICCDDKNRKQIISEFISDSFAKQVLVKGSTRISIILKENGRQADLRLVKEDEWGAALQYFTGSKEHNIRLRSIAKEKGYKISEYGIFRISDNVRVGGKKEEDIYNMLGMTFIPPEMREDKGEIALAMENRIPRIINLSDIRGDMQMHSKWSDGMNSIEEMAEYAGKKLGYGYIVITDHSKSTRIANGLDDTQILKQVDEIRKLNSLSGKPYILAGIEVDILPDGQLDIADEILARLDWVTASIHSKFETDNTERIIMACKNPYVNCIGHPYGRLIGSREAYPLDIDKVIKTAKATFTALEINAQPDRMDLTDNAARLAREAGVKLIISTDAHSTGNFEYMESGISIAQRAWCTANDILNTRPIDEVLEWRKKKLKNAGLSATQQ